MEQQLKEQIIYSLPTSPVIIAYLASICHPCPYPPPGDLGFISYPFTASFFLSISFTICGLAFPFVAFITCPTRKPIALAFPDM